jgi:hypothetical protein
MTAIIQAATTARLYSLHPVSTPAPAGRVGGACGGSMFVCVVEEIHGERLTPNPLKMKNAVGESMLGQGGIWSLYSLVEMRTSQRAWHTVTGKWVQVAASLNGC